MHADKHTRCRPTRLAGTLLTTGLLTTALLATTLATARVQAAVTARATSTEAGTAAPGWRVVKRIGPASDSPSGLIAAVSATDAWSVWSGPTTALIERWTGSEWTSVSLPPGLNAYARSAVAIGASSASDFWLFDTHQTTRALRLTGGRWRLQTIPSWVLRRSSGSVTATVAVFGADDVWVFSLNAGAYAAHYNGRTWTKVSLPAVPAGVSAAGPNDIWALGQAAGSVMHWNGTRWSAVRLPVLPLPVGATVTYSNLTAAGPKDVWLMRSIAFPSSNVPGTAMLHWNGKAWLAAPSPADIVGSLVPDGDGGLWANGIDINPGGFWLLYHLSAGRWTTYEPPSAVFSHSPEDLAWIPGTRSVWSIGSGLDLGSPASYYGLILKYGA